MELNLKPTYYQISRKLEAILQNQAPGGALKRGIQVVFDENGLQIYLPDNLKYGLYLHTGTGDETASGTTSNFTSTYLNLLKNPYDANPGVGEGGIKPRFWLNFSDSVYQMIYTEIEKAISKELEKGITKLLQPKA